MLFENLSLLYTSQLIFYSPLISNSATAKLSYLQTNNLYLNNINIHLNSFTENLNIAVQKEEIFDNKPFESVYGIGEGKKSMIIGGIITISIVFITNFIVLAFYCFIKSKNNEGSNELSMSSTLFTNLNQDINVNPSSN